MRIVVTGGMGCGKSTVVGYLRELLIEYSFFDFDKYVHGLYDDELVCMMLDVEFGTHKRSEVSDIVFSDPVKLTKLYSIMNANIFAALNATAKQNNVVIDMPLYFESSQYIQFIPDVVLCVTCPPDVQMSRIRERNQFTDEKICSILSKQLPNHEKESKSDFVIDTNDTFKHVKEKVMSFILKHIEANHG